VDDFSDSPKARKKKNFLDDLSNSGPAVRLYREGRATGPPKGRYKREDRYDYDPSAEDEAMSRDIDALNEEMVAAGVRIFVGGFCPRQ
jgi:hypothetical protein